MDPVIAGIVGVLGKYALDQAGELAKVVGKKALEKLGELFRFVVDRLMAKGPTSAAVVDEFKRDPDTYHKPMVKLVREEMEADQGFAEAVAELAADYNEALLSATDGAASLRVSGDLTSVASVFGGGSVSAGGDIIGGSKHVGKEVEPESSAEEQDRRR